MEDIGEKKVISKILVDSNISFTSHAWLCEENLWENCSYFTMKWFLLNCFGEMCFWGEKCVFEGRAINRCKTNKLWNFWERPLFEIWEYAFKQVTTSHIKEKKGLHTHTNQIWEPNHFLLLTSKIGWSIVLQPLGN